MRRIRIKLAYDGGGFHGWQVQPGLPTIQGTLEEIVSGMEGKPVHVAGSGRTDAGVHALEQVAAFSIANPIPLPNLRRAVNRLLPPAVRVLSAEEVHADFHPRFDAKAKTYEYRIVRGEVCSPFEWPYVHHYPYPLDEERMVDFARSSKASTISRPSPPPTIAMRRPVQGPHGLLFGAGAQPRRRLIYRVRGSGFLKHMVRNMVGTLIEAGRGNIPVSTHCRRDPARPLPAKGLFLVKVEYCMTAPNCWPPERHANPPTSRAWRVTASTPKARWESRSW